MMHTRLPRPHSHMKSSRPIRLAFPVVVALAFALVTPAAGFSESEEDLFGSSALVIDLAGEQVGSSLEQGLLVRDTVDVGGSYSLGLNAGWTWNNPEQWAEGKTAADDETFDLCLDSEVYVDVRPRTDFRGFGKVLISCPLTDLTDLSFGDVVELREAFVDFNIDERVFFRFGKHTIKWGVGYFFSPADIVNLAAIDPENPDAEREGPISLKINFPHRMDNYYLYLISGSTLDLSRLAFAPKAEFVVGETEFGVGAYYRDGQVPRVMASMTTSIGKSSVFAEAVLSYGSDRRFVREVPLSPVNPLGLEVFEIDDAIVASWTAGFMRTHSDEVARTSTSVAGQYFYNGEGYDDPGVLSRNAMGIALLIDAQVLSVSDLSLSGRQYGALSVSRSWTKGKGISVSASWLGNLSDGSGRYSLSVSSEPFDKGRLTVGVAASAGPDGAEFSPAGSSVELYARLNLGRYQF